MAAFSSIALAAGVAASAGGAVMASNAQRSASRRAADSATRAADQNNALQRDIYGQNAARLDPFAARGNTAGNAINALLGLGGGEAFQPQAQMPDMSRMPYFEPGRGRDYGGPDALGMGGVMFQDWRAQQQRQAPSPMDAQQAQEDAFDRFRDSTGYQFRLNEGANALQQQYAARGALQSGAAQRDLMRFGQDNATGAFGQYLNALMGQQQIGMGAASGLAGVGQNFANATSANNNSAASAVGNAALAQGYGTSNAIGQAVGGFNQLLGSSFGGAGFGGNPLQNARTGGPTIYTPQAWMGLPQVGPSFGGGF